MEPTFFRSGGYFRRWLEKHAAARSELLVGFYKKGSGRASMTWEESRDEALCFGWIDGIRRSRDAESYTIRFTPRTATSRWSKVNVERVASLTEQGRMTPAGQDALEARDPKNDAGYSYETRPAKLPPEYAQELAKDPTAQRYFDSQPPSYRKTCIHWVLDARREETRKRRLLKLIECSRNGEPIPPLARR